MLPFLFILGAFIFLTLVGQAVLSGLKIRFGVIWSWFLAPTVGVGVTILAVNAASKWGYPVKVAGPWITIGLAVAALAIFIWRRPVFPWRQLLPFYGILLVYLIYTGWPMFKFGFNWVSYGNDDMANYTLAAERFLNNSYYFLPTQTELEGRDYSQHFWFMHALQQIRPGSELLLSWACSITGLNPHQIFMPIVFVLTLLQLFSLGALTLYRGRYRTLALVALPLLAMSPLFSLGTLYQLIAQVGGISLLICVCSLLLRDIRFRWNVVAVSALMVAAIGVTYPEVAPFVALSILLFAARLRYFTPERLKPYTIRILVIAALTFAVMGINTYQFANTLILQSLGSAGLGAMADISQLDGLVLFPWTLVPSFLPMVFGLHAFGVIGTDPWISILIGLGIILLIGLLTRVLLSLWRGIPAAVLGMVMIPLGAFLFFKGQDFGLFKLGMFAQPVVAFFLAQGLMWLWAHNRRRTMLTVFTIYFFATIPSHFYYVRSAFGDVGGGLSEVVGASKEGVEFKPPADVKYDAIESDITNVVSAKMLAMYTRGTDTRFLSRNYMDNVANIAPLEFLRNPDPDFGDKRSQMLRPLHFIRWMLPDELMKGNVAGYNMMALRSIDNSWSETSLRHLNYEHPLFVALQPKYDHFNKFSESIGQQTGWREQGLYMFRPLAEVKDRLIFIHSEKGPHYYSSARFRASFFQREPEPISRGRQYFHGTGRHTMFQVLNPSSENLRLVVDFTRTSLGGPRSNLPANASIVGEENYPLKFVGHGSARLFTQPLKPQNYEGLTYLSLDFGEDGQMIYKEKTGLMRLYGMKYNLDDRRLVGFTRDISVITEEQYRNLKRPTRIASLPGDLYDNPGLEYSGLFEDGWISEKAYVNLAASKKGDVITFKGEIPDTVEFRKSGTTLVMTVNGYPSEPIPLKTGKFTLNRFVSADGDITRVEFAFSRAENYGTEDLRGLAAYLNEISLQPLKDFAAVLRTADRVSGDDFRFSGLDTDGWASKTASFRLPAASAPKVLELQLELPSWSEQGNNQIQVKVGDTLVYSDAPAAGTYQTIKIPISGPDSQLVTLTAQKEFKLPNEQNKLRSYRVTKLDLRDLAPDEKFEGATIRQTPAFEWFDVDADGWAGRRARLAVSAAAKATTAEFQLELPGWASSVTGKFLFTLNGRVVYSEEFPRGLYKTVQIQLDPGRDNDLVLEASHEFYLPPPDQRLRSYRIVKSEIK